MIIKNLGNHNWSKILFKMKEPACIFAWEKTIFKKRTLLKGLVSVHLFYIKRPNNVLVECKVN